MTVAAMAMVSMKVLDDATEAYGDTLQRRLKHFYSGDSLGRPVRTSSET
jgi:hypothetical protein